MGVHTKPKGDGRAGASDGLSAVLAGRPQALGLTLIRLNLVKVPWNQFHTRMASIPHARFPDAFRQARGGGLATAFAPLMISLDDGVTREALMAHAERVYQAHARPEIYLRSTSARFPLSFIRSGCSSHELAFL